MSIFRFRDGRIAERWQSLDALGLLRPTSGRCRRLPDLPGPRRSILGLLAAAAGCGGSEPPPPHATAGRLGEAARAEAILMHPSAERRRVPETDATPPLAVMSLSDGARSVGSTSPVRRDGDRPTGHQREGHDGGRRRRISSRGHAGVRRTVHQDGLALAASPRRPAVACRGAAPTRRSRRLRREPAKDGARRGPGRSGRRRHHPSWVSSPSASSDCHRSAIRPSRKRKIDMPSISTLRPMAGTPKNSAWVPLIT